MINIKKVISYEEIGTCETVYMDIISSRNAVISKYTDVSPFAKTEKGIGSIQQEKISNDTKEEAEDEAEQRDIWYPVVDIDLDDEMYAAAVVEGHGNFQMNQTHLETADGDTVIEYSKEKLEEWENNFLTSGPVYLKDFRIRKKCRAEEGSIKEMIRPLSDNWEGEIQLWTTEAGEKKILYREKIKAEQKRESGEQEIDLESPYIKALLRTIKYILRNQVKKEDSIYHQGLYLFYDHDAKMFRQPSWVWTWGPAISTLLEAAAFPEVVKKYPKEVLYEAACRIGEASLRFQLTEDSSHPAYGLVYCRRDYNLKIKNGYMEFLSPPDSLFLAGWGWIPLYVRTGDKRYLEAAKLLVEQTFRILQTNSDIIEQDYMIPANKWKDWILDEAGFGMKAFAQLYEVYPDKRYLEWGKQYIEQILKCFEREDGLWDRMWTRSTQTVSEISYYTRAMGWAMEGLLSSYQLLKDEKYLKKADKMARAMLQYQNEDGSWNFRFDKGFEELGISEKGTAYWSGLLYRLYDYTNDLVYKEAANKALNWCLENQYWGDDPDGAGGIIGRTPSSGIIYRRFFDLSCTYTSAFFGDALIRAIKQGF